MPNTLVIAELHEGAVRKSTHSAINFARQTGGAFSILVLGPGSKVAAKEIEAYGAAKILVADDAYLANGVAERIIPTIVETVTKGGFDVVAVTASSFGKDIAPGVAAKLNAGYAPDIAGVKADGGKLVYRRPVYAGNAYATCSVNTPLQVVSVRQSEFAAAEPSGGASPIEDVAVGPKDPAAERVEFVSLDAAKSERPDLGEARVIVSGGRALKEKFAEVLDPLANGLNAAVGASRAACDAARLYFAIGISGAIQHLAGMKGSKVIVAINKDADAPIFQVADYGLVADLFTAVPELVTELKKAT